MQMRLKRLFLCSFLLIALIGCQPVADSPTLSGPRLTVRESTNCRTGPGEPYTIIYIYPPGTQLEIVGRYYDDEYFWVVRSGESPTGTCWMWGGSVDVTGDFSKVANVTPPPAATSGPAQTLIVDQWEYSCEGDTVVFTLSWQDRAAEETGYRLFRNGAALVELPAGSTAYTDRFTLPEDRSVEYYLQAFGTDWTANSAMMTADC